jgi:hypothetical protein
MGHASQVQHNMQHDILCGHYKMNVIKPMAATRAHALSPVEEIIEEARNGRMFILVDDENRENEGDLIIPARTRPDLSRPDTGTRQRAGPGLDEPRQWRAS